MSNSIMFIHESRPMRSLKDKYRIDKALNIRKEVLRETGFCSVGFGECSAQKPSAFDETQM